MIFADAAAARGSAINQTLRGTLLVLAAVGLLALPVGAAGLGEETSVQEDAPILNAANPAAAYCKALGYEYEIISTPRGEQGICILPDGQRVDAWELFRGQCAEEYSYCARQGYELRTIDAGNGSYSAECAVCVDGSGVVLGTVAELMGLFPESAFETVGMEMPMRTVAEAPDRSGHRGLSRPADVPVPQHRELPAYFDWRDYDGCTPIKNQGSCGSCWAFSTVAPLECNILIKDGIEEDLSEQYLVSCNRDGWSCSGGWYAHNYHMWKGDPCGETGPVLEADFPYAAEDLPCDCPYPNQHQYLLRSWDYIGDPGGVSPTDEMKQAILDHGPISVALAVGGSFGSYSGGVFNDCGYTSINHAVALVGWDDNQGAEGIWFLRNSWGPGWGEDGYMRIPYGCDLVGYNSCWVDYPGLTQLAFSYPDGLPEVIPPEEPTSITVQIDDVYDEYVPGSGMFYYRLDGGDFQSEPLTPLGRGLFTATLPPAACPDTPEFYFTAEGAASGTHSDPEDAPDVAYRTRVGELMTVFRDDFESDTGWTVENDAGLTDGAWERGIPAGGGDRGDPPTDFDGSGRCYVTDNEDGNSDVDGGATRLISPPVNLVPHDQALLRVAVWYTNLCGDAPHRDVFEIFLSDNDGADWVLAETIGPRSSFGWNVHLIMISDYVSLTGEVRAQLVAADLGDGSIVEAGVDDFSISSFDCGFSSAGERAGGVTRLVLAAGSPNPFDTQTIIRYALPRPASVGLHVLGIDGRSLRALWDGQQQDGGWQQVVWDGRDDLGRRVPSGVYYCRLTDGRETLTRRVIRVE